MSEDMKPVPASQAEAVSEGMQPVPAPRTFSPPSRGKSIQVDGKYYSIGNLLGQGYFGSVYECSDEWENHLVAKVLVPKNQTYDEVRQNWLDELAKLLRLRHPNITYVHAAFECDDTFYIVMERCSMTLDVVINLQGLLPDNWVPHVARDVLQGLEYIHISGYVHKDIHPGNIFVSQSQDRMVPTRDAVWSFKIGDLGISRLETEINAFNTILAQWMLPPEAIQPEEFGQVGRAVDVYHVGLLLLAISLNRVPTFTQQEILEGCRGNLLRRVHPGTARQLAAPFVDIQSQGRPRWNFGEPFVLPLRIRPNDSKVAYMRVQRPIVIEGVSSPSTDIGSELVVLDTPRGLHLARHCAIISALRQDRCRP